MTDIQSLRIKSNMLQLTKETLNYLDKLHDILEERSEEIDNKNELICKACDMAITFITIKQLGAEWNDVEEHIQLSTDAFSCNDIKTRIEAIQAHPIVKQSYDLLKTHINAKK